MQLDPEQSQERGQEDMQVGDKLQSLTLDDLDLYDGPSYKERMMEAER